MDSWSIPTLQLAWGFCNPVYDFGEEIKPMFPLRFPVQGLSPSVDVGHEWMPPVIHWDCGVSFVVGFPQLGWNGRVSALLWYTGPWLNEPLQQVKNLVLVSSINWESASSDEDCGLLLRMEYVPREILWDAASHFIILWEIQQGPEELQIVTRHPTHNATSSLSALEPCSGDRDQSVALLSIKPPNQPWTNLCRTCIIHPIWDFRPCIPHFVSRLLTTLQRELGFLAPAVFLPGAKIANLPVEAPEVTN